MEGERILAVSYFGVEGWIWSDFRVVILRFLQRGFVFVL